MSRTGESKNPLGATGELGLNGGLGDQEETHPGQETGHGGACPPCLSQGWRTRASQPQTG